MAIADGGRSSWRSGVFVPSAAPSCLDPLMTARERSEQENSTKMLIPA